jgi:glycosyltransferase involved in cell wall biosynthesis
MRVLLICANYGPEFQGGTEVVVKAEARALQAAGHEVQVLTGSSEVSPAGSLHRETLEGIAVLRACRTPSEALAPEWLYPRLLEVAREAARDVDLVHLHHWSGLSGDLVRGLAPAAPVVITLHDHYASCPRYFRTPPADITCPPVGEFQSCARCVAEFVPELSDALLQVRLAARAESFRAELQAAAAVIAPSEYLRDALARELGVSAVHWRVLPHGLCREFASQMREGSGEGPLTVLHFGNRTPIKGALDLVRALRDEPNVRLILAGRELEPGFDELLRREAGSLQLELHGSYDARELRRLARGCDLAAFPSRAFESYGLVVEEALALGLPVWVSDRGALPEVLHRAAHFGSLPGGVVPAESPSAWRTVLRELVADEEKLQDAAARVPARMRTAADTTRDLLEIFSTLTTQSSAP